MKIAYTITDQEFAHTRSIGIYNCSRGILEGLIQSPRVSEIHVLANPEWGQQGIGSDKIHWNRLNQPTPRRLGRVLWDQVGVTQAMNRLDVDWCLFPKGFPPLLSWPKARVACYVHDIIWEYYLDQKASITRRLNDYYFSSMAKRALNRSDAVFTSSQFNVDRFRSICPSARVQRVGIGFDQVQMSNEGGPEASNDILIYLSPHRHKLTAQGISWLRAWKETTGDPRTVYGLGSPPEGVDWPVGDDWVHLGRVTDEEMHTLRARCAVTLYFSEYEGFGMPPLESWLAGVPCLASDIPPLRETIPAEFLFSNDDQNSFLARLDAVLTSHFTPYAPIVDNWSTVAERMVDYMLDNPAENRK